MQGDGKGILRCNQRYLVKECQCRSATIRHKEANEVVLAALRQQIQLLVKEAELSKNARNKTIPYSEGAEIKTLIKTITTMKKHGCHFMSNTQTVSYPERTSSWKRRNMMKKLQDWSKGYMSFKAGRTFSKRVTNRRKKYQSVALLCQSDGTYGRNKGEAD